MTEEKLVSIQGDKILSLENKKNEANLTAVLIEKICVDIQDLLLKKNQSYGDSALNPVRIFSKASSKEQILVRIDDKLNRIKQGLDILDKDEDVLQDLIGYLILLKVWKERKDYEERSVEN